MKNKKQANWFYEKQGKQIGPVSADKIQALVEADDLSHGDMLWKQGAPAWIKLEESELKYLLANKPPPLKKKYKMNRCVVAIILFIVFQMLFYNYHKAGIYMERYAFTNCMGHSGYTEPKVSDRVNAFWGYFITFGIAPDTGIKVVRGTRKLFSPTGTYQDKLTHEKTNMVEIFNEVE